MTREEVIRDLKEIAQGYAELHREAMESKRIEIYKIGVCSSVYFLISCVFAIVFDPFGLLGVVSAGFAVGVLIYARHRERYWNAEMAKVLKLRQECLEVIDRI